MICREVVVAGKKRVELREFWLERGSRGVKCLGIGYENLN
jgi:hypothetical protein